MRHFVLAFAIATTFLFWGCATTIPTTSNINDFVMMGIKTNNNEKVDFKYSSKVVDGKINAYTKDEAEVVGGSGYEHSEASSMRKMISEYMGNKFPNLIANGSTKISISFEDFHIEQYSEESTGKAIATALLGGKSDLILVAKVKVIVVVNKNGQETTKVITGSSEDRYTSVSTSALSYGGSRTYDKNDSVEGVHGKNINNANNKILMLLNAYFQELGL
jgi:hypothetical protein